MSLYIHERKDWPRFKWNQASLACRISAVRHRQGRLIGRMETLGFPLRAETVLRTLTLDDLKSSEIEGEMLNMAQVPSRISTTLSS
jgi:Fic family protein